jgi:hypothetical protein
MRWTEPRRLPAKNAGLRNSDPLVGNSLQKSIANIDCLPLFGVAWWLFVFFPVRQDP